MLRSVPRSKCLARAIILRDTIGDETEADTFGCVLPPAIAAAGETGNTSALRVQISLNGLDFVDELSEGLAPRYI